MLTKIGSLILAILIWEGCKHAIEAESVTASDELKTSEKNITAKILNKISVYQNTYMELRKKFSSTEKQECFEWVFQGAEGASNKSYKWVSITSVGKNKAALQDTTDNLCTEILGVIGVDGFNCTTNYDGKSAVKCPKDQDGEMEIIVGISSFQPIKMKFPIGSDSKLFD